MLNIRIGEEDLVVRNAAVWADKIQNLLMQTNTIHTAWRDCIGRDLEELWSRITAIWPVPARESLCECLSLAIFQSDGYCLSLEQDHGQVLGWQSWDSLCTHWSLKAKSSETAWVKVTSSACLIWDLRHYYLPHDSVQSLGRKLWRFLLKADGPSMDSQSIHNVSDAVKGRAQGVPLPHVLVEQMGAVPNCFSRNWRTLFDSNALTFFLNNQWTFTNFLVGVWVQHSKYQPSTKHFWE